MSMRGEEKSGIYRLHGYCARAVFREVFFVSAAQRKSRKTRGQGIRPFDLPAAKCYTCHNSSLQSTLPLQATELLAPAAVAKCA